MRSSKVSLSENIPIEQILRTPQFDTRDTEGFFSPGVSKQLQGAISRSIEQNNHLMVPGKTLMKLLYKDEFKTNILRRLDYYKILYFIPLAA